MHLGKIHNQSNSGAILIILLTLTIQSKSSLSTDRSSLCAAVDGSRQGDLSDFPDSCLAVYLPDKRRA